MTFQKEISVGPFSRGFHLITEKIINELPIMTGLVNVFIKHTSASLTINENADPSVREDFEAHFNIMIPENAKYYIKQLEKFINAKISSISTSPERKDTILIENPFG